MIEWTDDSYGNTTHSWNECQEVGTCTRETSKVDPTNPLTTLSFLRVEKGLLLLDCVRRHSGGCLNTCGQEEKTEPKDCGEKQMKKGRL